MLSLVVSEHLTVKSKHLDNINSLVFLNGRIWHSDLLQGHVRTLPACLEIRNHTHIVSVPHVQFRKMISNINPISSCTFLHINISDT